MKTSVKSFENPGPAQSAQFTCCVVAGFFKFL